MNQVFILPGNPFCIERRFRIANMLLNLVTRDFNNLVDFVCQRLIGFAANERLRRDLDFFTTGKQGFDGCRRLHDRLFLRVADMIQSFDVIGEHQ